MQKKKILFYTSGIGLGGVERVLIELLKFIDKEKFDVKVAFQNGNERYFENEIPKQIEYRFMLKKELIDKTIYFKERKKNIFYKLGYLIMMKYEKFIIRKEFLKFSNDRDIIIDFKSGDFYKVIQLNKKARKMCWLHNEITKVSNYKKRKKRLEKFFEKCEKVICICNEMKENLIKEMPKIKDKIEVIYNCFDIEKIERRAEEISDLNNNEIVLLKKDYFIMVGRLDDIQKDYSTLVKAYKRYFDKNIKAIKLYLLGDGPDRKKIEIMLEKEKLKKNIILLGAKKNPYPWIKNCKMLIHSSKFEGLPTVLIEALILNKKIISTNCPTGPKEILENGKIGTLVNIGNIKEMSEAIEKELNINIDKEEIKKSRERFNGSIIIKKVEEIFL